MNRKTSFSTRISFRQSGLSALEVWSPLLLLEWTFIAFRSFLAPFSFLALDRFPHFVNFRDYDRRTALHIAGTVPRLTTHDLRCSIPSLNSVNYM